MEVQWYNFVQKTYENTIKSSLIAKKRILCQKNQCCGSGPVKSSSFILPDPDRPDSTLLTEKSVEYFQLKIFKVCYVLIISYVFNQNFSKVLPQ